MMELRYLSLLPLLMLIAACQSTPPVEKKAEAEKPVAVVKPEKAETRVAALPERPEAPKPAPTAAKPAPVYAPPSLTILQGKKFDEVMTLLGTPSLRRRDTAAEVWQYANDVCSMHIFFYPGASSPGLVVDHVAVNGKSLGADKIDPDQCFEGQLRSAGTLEKLRAAS